MCFILSLRLYSSFITLRPVIVVLPYYTHLLFVTLTPISFMEEMVLGTTIAYDIKLTTEFPNFQYGTGVKDQGQIFLPAS